jgi:hypothetical protein
MNPEAPQGNIYFGNDRRTFARPPVNTPESELLKEQALKTTCQEIVDLYSMLRHKSIHGTRLHGLNKESRLDLLQSGSNLKRSMLDQGKVNLSGFVNHLNEVKGETA